MDKLRKILQVFPGQEITLSNPLAVELFSASETTEGVKNVIKKGVQQYQVLNDFFPALSRKIDVTIGPISNFASTMKIKDPQGVTTSIRQWDKNIQESALRYVQITSKLMTSLDLSSQRLGLSEDAKKSIVNLSENVQRIKKDQETDRRDHTIELNEAEIQIAKLVDNQRGVLAAQTMRGFADIFNALDEYHLSMANTYSLLAREATRIATAMLDQDIPIKADVRVTEQKEVTEVPMLFSSTKAAREKLFGIDSEQTLNSNQNRPSRPNSSHSDQKTNSTPNTQKSSIQQTQNKGTLFDLDFETVLTPSNSINANGSTGLNISNPPNSNGNNSNNQPTNLAKPTLFDPLFNMPVQSSPSTTSTLIDDLLMPIPVTPTVQSPPATKITTIPPIKNEKIPSNYVIENWKNKGGRKTSLRGLLVSLHEVVTWESSWTPLSLNDLVETEQVKEAYRRACTVVHPDKLASSSQQLQDASQKIFTALREAYNSFKTELSKEAQRRAPSPAPSIRVGMPTADNGDNLVQNQAGVD